MSELPPNTVVVRAPAKVNLFLRVLGRRDNGFHDLETLVAPIDLSDRLVIRARSDLGTSTTPSISLEVTGEPAITQGVPDDETNLVVRAGYELAKATGVRGFADVVLTKRVPSAAGLGGGSADAAAALRALNTLWGCRLGEDDLRRIGARVGSDVPALLVGGPTLARGRGERVEPVAARGFTLALVTFSFGVSSADAFEWWDEDGCATGPDPAELLRALGPEASDRAGSDVSALRALAHNDLEAPVARRLPVVREARDYLLRAGAALALMCGSGPSLAGILPDGVSSLEPGALTEIERISGRPVRYTTSERR